MLKYDESTNIYSYSLKTVSNTTFTLSSICLKLVDTETNNMVFEFLPNTNNNEQYCNLRNLERTVIKQLADNSVNMLGFDVKEESLINMLISVIKLPDSIPSMPYIKLSFTDDIRLEDKDGDEMTLSCLAKNNLVTVDVILDKVQFHKQYFKIDMEAIRVKIDEYYCSTNYDLSSDFSDCSNCSE